MFGFRFSSWLATVFQKSTSPLEYPMFSTWSIVYFVGIGIPPNVGIGWLDSNCSRLESMPESTLGHPRSRVCNPAGIPGIRYQASFRNLPQTRYGPLPGLESNLATTSYPAPVPMPLYFSIQYSLSRTLGLPNLACTTCVVPGIRYGLDWAGVLAPPSTY